ncbi:methyl-accepting chemotaxis protein, partial [Salmonella enterica subsp. enterica serovar Infantis]|nr:methyl-accepting chemotaxis protein [Salmonella enterica subsp. enterica serovar Infantis]
ESAAAAAALEDQANELRQAVAAFRIQKQPRREASPTPLSKGLTPQPAAEQANWESF